MAGKIGISHNTVHLIINDDDFGTHSLHFPSSSWPERITAHFTFYPTGVVARLSLGDTLFKYLAQNSFMKSFPVLRGEQKPRKKFFYE